MAILGILSYFTRGRVRFLIQLKGMVWSLKPSGILGQKNPSAKPPRMRFLSTEVLGKGSWFSMQRWAKWRFFRASFWAHNLNSVVIGYAAVFADEKLPKCAWYLNHYWQFSKASKMNLPVFRPLLKSIIDACRCLDHPFFVDFLTTSPIFCKALISN